MLSFLVIFLRAAGWIAVLERIPGRRARVVYLAASACRGSKGCPLGLGLSGRPTGDGGRIRKILKTEDFEDHWRALMPDCLNDLTLTQWTASLHYIGVVWPIQCLGYPYALGLMLALAAGLWGFFKRKGWL